jgi:hypothetical protein
MFMARQISSGQLRRLAYVSSIFGFLTITTFSFQNCSNKVSFNDAKLTELSIPEGSIQINESASYTNNQSVSLKISAKDSAQMMLGNDVCPEDLPENWSPLVSEKEWLLADGDSAHTVYVRFKSNDGHVSDCAADSIVLDRGAPTVEFLSAPDNFVKLATAQFEIKAEDAVSGVDKILCRLSTGSQFEICSEAKVYANLTEGTKSVVIKVQDRAGNVSEPKEHTWNIDLTAPITSIIDPKLAPVVYTNVAQIYFESTDGVGSGIDSHVCYLNDVLIANCSSPVLLQNLVDGNYKFRVKSIDKVGWESQFAEVNFTADLRPSEAFNILGIAGGADDKVDNYLSAAAAPYVYWTPSLGAQSFNAYILSEDKGQLICGPVNVNAAAVSALFANCALVDGAKYYARVIALKNGLQTAAPDYLFTVDTSGPVITITSVTKVDEEKKIRFDFSIVDVGSGVESATCYKVFNNAAQASNCSNVTYIDYINLSAGNYSFYISATDKLGHTSTSTPYNFVMEYVVCDPFKLVEGKCQKGLKARLYYASAADRLLGNSALNTKYNTVGKLIAGGLKSNAIIYLPYLDTRTREFTDGFSVAGDNTNFLKDDNGVKLDEWFALDMETVIKLGPNDLPGYYQLMSISDDGSMVSIDQNNTGSFRLFINNEGIHSTRVACPAANDVLLLDANSRVKAQVQYYQGPRTKIAMSLFWRKVDAPNAARSSACGSTSFSYSSLINEGYVPMKDVNFITAEAVAP